jgi:hypothetical protein
VVKATDWGLRGYGTAGPQVQGPGAVLTSPIVRDDRGSALLFRCQAFDVRQLLFVKTRGFWKVEVVMAEAGNMFSFRHWEIPDCILVLGKRCFCMVHLRIFPSFS